MPEALRAAIEQTGQAGGMRCKQARGWLNDSMASSRFRPRFTAIGTMTTAYFGIKAMSNTAKSLKSP